MKPTSHPSSNPHTQQADYPTTPDDRLQSAIYLGYLQKPHFPEAQEVLPLTPYAKHPPDPVLPSTVFPPEHAIQSNVSFGPQKLWGALKESEKINLGPLHLAQPLHAPTLHPFFLASREALHPTHPQYKAPPSRSTPHPSFLLVHHPPRPQP